MTKNLKRRKYREGNVIYETTPLPQELLKWGFIQHLEMTLSVSVFVIEVAVPHLLRGIKFFYYSHDTSK